ncbi:MAG: hypothetical protein ABIW38_00955 [Ferruginibacter sp.]
MPPLNMEIINYSIADKLCGLLKFLRLYKTAFEIVAEEVEDCNLRTALYGLSAESIQYADEITTQLKTHGIPYRLDTDMMADCLDKFEENFNLEMPGKGNELTNICNCSENSITNAYNDVLNEYLPLASLRNVMLYQLNALKLSFLKVKMLNNARFAGY